MPPAEHDDVSELAGVVSSAAAALHPHLSGAFAMVVSPASLKLGSNH